MVEPETPRLTNAEALIQFAGDSTEQRHDALTVLIASKFLPKNAEDASIKSRREKLLFEARTHLEPSYRLLAIADSIRLAQVVQRWLPEITVGLEPAFVNELPPLNLLEGEGKDRLNVARACALYEREWLPDFIANSIAEEKEGEKARVELMAVLLTRSNSLANALILLAKHFERLRPAWFKRGSHAPRRLLLLSDTVGPLPRTVIAHESICLPSSQAARS